MNKEELKTEIKTRAEELNELLIEYTLHYKLGHTEKLLFKDLSVALAEIRVPELF